MILIDGAGNKAFCAGGDVAALAKWNTEGAEGQQRSKDYFALEYQLDHLIATYSKPYIAIMDGITMGGGVGLSVHAPIRIATERTVFAMPETTIGFFPDVGGSFSLPRLDGEIGTYLALTSERLAGVQTLYAGIATHYLDSSVLTHLTTRLSELIFKDYATLPERLSLINSTLSEFSTGLAPVESEPMQLAGPLRETIDRCFSYDSVADILSALKREKGGMSEWAQKTHHTMTARSPTSLKVTLRQLRLGRNWKINETFQREHHIASQFMSASPSDFVEGVTARLINKPPTTPNWNPATLDEISNSEVEAFFRMPDGEARLSLLSSSTSPQANYLDYPHPETLTLPRERAIEKVVKESIGEIPRGEIVQEFVKRWNGKEGVKEKVTEVLARKTRKTPGGCEWID